MMKRFLCLFALAAVVLGAVSPGFAAERPGVLKAFGGIHKGSQGTTPTAQNTKLISGSGQRVTGVSINASGTACTVSLYDTAEVNEATNAKGKHEDSAAANTGSFRSFDPPLDFKSGIVMVTDGNEDGVVIYTEQATP